MRPLTNRQRELLAFILRYTRKHKLQPSIREMVSHMGVRSTNAVQHHIIALEEKGYITRTGKLRALKLPRCIIEKKGEEAVVLMDVTPEGWR